MEMEGERVGGGVGSYTKAEVGVVFPVNTELQRVGGERFSDGFADSDVRPEFKMLV